MSVIWSTQSFIIVLIYSCTFKDGLGFTPKYRTPRQAGYFYDKPSVSFDLPVRPQVTTGVTPIVTSVAPPVRVKTVSQMMYYAYPVPTGGAGESVNIGYSSPSTSSVAISSTTTPRPSSGYNYDPRTATTVGVTQISTTATSGYQTGGSIPVSTNAAGYNYNVPQSPSTDGTVSTNAPKYLPPTPGPRPGIQTNANVPSPTPTPTISQPGTSAPLPTLNTNYLPPSPLSNAPAPPSAPNVFPVVTINATPSPSYLPPVTPTQRPTPNPISTPAPTYLPPFF